MIVSYSISITDIYERQTRYIKFCISFAFIMTTTWIVVADATDVQIQIMKHINWTMKIMDRKGRINCRNMYSWIRWKIILTKMENINYTDPIHRHILWAPFNTISWHTKKHENSLCVSCSVIFFWCWNLFMLWFLFRSF